MSEMRKKEYLLRLDKFSLEGATTNRIIRYFSDVNLGNGHPGLRKLAQKHGVNVDKLCPGEFVIFVNKRQSGLKMFVAGNVVAYLKMPGNSRLDLRAIQYIPTFFNGEEIDWIGAVSKAIEKDIRGL